MTKQNSSPMANYFNSVHFNIKGPPLPGRPLHPAEKAFQVTQHVELLRKLGNKYTDMQAAK